ncbi:glycosyltransferase family 2 protein [Desulfosudis oleivorans]|uniref:Glycosyl transferase family 2 n=1 Tax=Desulfosudis oleivorans (strain DSM 6200 / JCM 39069 / Hxd3) TaxID=96561 RepID=A8ZVM9_DESOH|nr:glycosyltransferase family 2 protein [Desulfosudis oleivorans]ABW68216.1 glycosyl transferase family 2 [Desulfosudis oleivorans Hxd3]
MKRLVIIPCYNEEKTVGAIAEAARPHADLCFVNDASTDQTGDRLHAISGIHIITHARRTHIPGAILDGMRFAADNGYDVAVTMDAGLSHDPKDLPRFFEHDGYDLVIGARRKTIGTPAHRKLISQCAARIVNYGLSDTWHDLKGPAFSDCTSGFRMYSKKALQTVLNASLASRSFGFHMETLAVIYTHGLSIQEIPVTYTFTNSSFNSAAVGDGLRVGIGLIRKKIDNG